jgi:hypothetical protein
MVARAIPATPSRNLPARRRRSVFPLMGINLVDFGDPSQRELWASILPPALVLVFCTTLVPVPGLVRSAWQRVSRPFRNPLTLEQAEAYEAAHEQGSPTEYSTPKSVTSIFRTTILSGLALLQVLAWLGLGSYSFAINAKVWDGILPLLTAVTWLYAFLRPIIWPSQTIFYPSAKRSRCCEALWLLWPSIVTATTPLATAPATAPQ